MASPPALGTVWTARVWLYDSQFNAVGSCMDTPNSIAKAFMERPELAYVKDACTKRLRDRAEYADRMASWNVAESLYHPRQAVPV